MAFELQCEKYKLQYEYQGDEVTIIGIDGFVNEVEIPERIDGKCVTTIGKKAFMGKRLLKKVSLPASISKIEDWAFSHCEMLKEVSLYPNDLQLGKGVFLECEKLASAKLVKNPEGFAGDDETLEQLSGLLASTMIVLDAPFLFTPSTAGSEEWMRQYEARVASFLEKDDMEDYAKTVSCGEEDYESTNLENFLSDKRKAKIRMILIRLLNPYMLAEENKEAYQEYLRKHMPLGDLTETWQVVRDEHGDEERYYDVLASAGCITADNVQTLIADLGGSRAQMRAYLLRYQEKNLKKKDFFDSFSL